jgi:hypothetical protein
VRIKERWGAFINHCCSIKQCVTYSECVSVALVIQHAMRVRYIVVCGLSGCTVFFPHYLIIDTIFEEKNLLDTKCVFWFSLQLLSETFLSLRSIKRDMIKKCLLVFLWTIRHFNAILVKPEFLFDRFPKNTQIPNFINICPVLAKFHADRRA